MTKPVPSRYLTVENFLAPLTAEERKRLEAEEAPSEVPSGDERAGPMNTGPIIDPKAPFDVAGSFISHEHFFDKQPTIRFWRGRFYRWSDGVWVGCEVRQGDKSDVTDELWHWLSNCLYVQGKTLKDYLPNASSVFQVKEGLAARAGMKGEADTLGSTGKPLPFNAVVVRNGILNLDDQKLLPHDPDLFNTAMVAADWHPELEGKFDGSEWQRFLRSGGLGGDQIDLLRMWLGYLICGDNRFQKALSFIGPPRCGKGTALRVLQRLMGPSGYTTLRSRNFGDTFGMQHLVEARIGAITDMRTNQRTDHASVAEAILAITGGDHQTVQRKHIAPWEGTLPTRFVFCSNSLPDLRDETGTLATRFSTIVFSKSHLGREDVNLDARLAEEDGMLLAWAVGGYRDLIKAGGFPDTDASTHARIHMMTRQNPVQPFVVEYFDHDPRGFVPSADLHALFQSWSDLHGIGEFSQDALVKRMVSTMSGEGIRNTRTRRKTKSGASVRVRGLSGLKVKADKEAEVREALKVYREGDFALSFEEDEP